MIRKTTRMLATTRNIYENTPKAFYEQLNTEFSFDFDPCPDRANFNGLMVDWGIRCYVNPPYGKAIRNWLEKALIELKTGRTELVVFLLPAYTDVKWFHEIVLPLSNEIRFIKGRLKFGEHKQPAPFASMLVVFRKA